MTMATRIVNILFLLSFGVCVASRFDLSHSTVRITSSYSSVILGGSNKRSSTKQAVFFHLPLRSNAYDFSWRWDRLRPTSTVPYSPNFPMCALSPSNHSNLACQMLLCTILCLSLRATFIDESCCRRFGNDLPWISPNCSPYLACICHVTCVTNVDLPCLRHDSESV